jgi:hypothetical protein
VTTATPRPPIWNAILAVLVLAVLLIGATASNLILHHSQVPPDRPYVVVETNVCLMEDGESVTMDYGQPCPSGSTPNGTLFIESYPPTP